MSAGRIDATFFNPSEVPQATKAGFAEIIQMADIGFEVQGSGLATSRSYIKSQRETVKYALKAYIEGIYFVFANKAETLKSLARYMRTKRFGRARVFVPALFEADAEKAVSDLERDPEPDRHVRIASSSGERRQAGAVRRSELSAGARSGKFFDEMARRYK